MGFLGILRENCCRARLLHLQYARVARWLVVFRWMEVDGAPANPGPLLLAMMRDSKFMGKQHGHTLETHTFFVVYRCMSLQWEEQFLPEFC